MCSSRSGILKNNHFIFVGVVIFCVFLLEWDSAIAGDTLFTQGDIVNLRNDPNAESRIIEKLYIGTSVTVNIRKGDWFWVDVNSALSISSGWIKSNLLGKNSPKLSELLTNYKSTTLNKMKQKCMWLERASALEPLNIKVLELLHDCKIKDGDELSAKSIKNKIEYIRNPSKYQDKNEDKIVFLYSYNTIVPLTVLDDGFMLKPYNSDKNRNKFVDKYVKLGRRYDLLSNHGLPVSTVQVAREPLVYFKKYENCDSPIGINVKTSEKPEIKINMGFVTNFKVKTKIHKYPKSVSKKLIQAIDTESENVIKRKKVSWDKELPIDISIFDLDHDGVPEIMSVKKYLHNINSERESNAGFFVVMLWKKNSNQSYEPVYTVTEGISEKYAYLYVDSYKLFGVMDMDGDGVDEIVTSIGVYEGSGYEVHTFKSGIWAKTNLLLFYGTC